MPPLVFFGPIQCHRGAGEVHRHARAGLRGPGLGLVVVAAGVAGARARVRPVAGVVQRGVRVVVGEARGLVQIHVVQARAHRGRGSGVGLAQVEELGAVGRVVPGHRRDRGVGRGRRSARLGLRQRDDGSLEIVDQLVLAVLRASDVVRVRRRADLAGLADRGAVVVGGVDVRIRQPAPVGPAHAHVVALHGDALGDVVLVVHVLEVRAGHRQRSRRSPSLPSRRTSRPGTRGCRPARRCSSGSRRAGRSCWCRRSRSRAGSCPAR